MKIQEIGTLDMNTTQFKLSERSITARQNDKTVAVINDIQKVQSMPFSKKADINVQFKGKLNEFMNELYISLDNRLYYFIDQNYHDLVLKSAAHGDTSSFHMLNKKVKTLAENNVNVIYAYTY
jgi:hypothetical protein